MSTNSDIRLSVGFLRHPKVVRLKRRCGTEGILALIQLWLFVAEERPGGQLDGLEEDLASLSGWPGDPLEFVEALLELGWLYRGDGDTLSVHQWETHQPWAAGAEKRSQHARALAHLSWEKRRARELAKKGEKPGETAPRNAGRNAERIAPFLTSPDLSLPSPPPSPPPPPDLPGNWGPEVDLKALFGVENPGGGNNFRTWMRGLWKEAIGKIPKHHRAREFRIKWIAGEASLDQIRAAILDPGTAEALSPTKHVLGILDKIRPKDSDPWD